MNRKILVAPSILAADFSGLREELRRAEKAGADMIHVDVMDGHFVPNITIGALVVRDIRRVTKLPLDVHLMIEQPSSYIDEFVKAGSDIITVHAESERSLASLISRIKASGVKVGVSLRPGSGINLIRRHLKKVNMVLIMTVEPGFGGQKFISGMLPKIKGLREIYNGDIEVDGGINKSTAKKVIRAGANIIVAGTAVFKAKDIKKAIKALRVSTGKAYIS